MKRVGVLGGGQLGSLLLESIYRLGGTAAIYDPDKMAHRLSAHAACVQRGLVGQRITGKVF